MHDKRLLKGIEREIHEPYDLQSEENLTEIGSHGNEGCEEAE